MVEVTLIGTGALLPIPERALSSVLITYCGRSVLVDCGEGTQSAARAASVSLMKTDVIALTHYHGDHVFGIPGLLMTMNCMGRREPLMIVGPGDVQSELAPLMTLAGTLNYEVSVVTAGNDPIRFGGAGDRQYGAELIPFETSHRVVSCGYVFRVSRPGVFIPENAQRLGIPYRFWGILQRGENVTVDGMTFTPDQVLGQTRKGISVTVSGDTVPCQTLIAAAENTDLLICEATYGENTQEDIAAEHGHMTFAQAGKVAAGAGASRLWTTHYSQMISDPEEYIDNARKFFPGAECGTDGKKITLRFE